MRPLRIGALMLGLVLIAAPVVGQTTGSVNGTVTDNSGGVLPGVTVTATSPAMMGPQTTVTNEQGQYRLPALTPGIYTLVYELTGFSSVVREGIVVSIGFTATISVQMQLASLQETVTVTGGSPVVDVQNTNIQNTFSSDLLKSLPNARDVWGLVMVSPGTMMSSFDVGGSRAGNQTGFSAYGYGDQLRWQVDGANTTEGTSGNAGFTDYSSFDEVQIGTDANDASMPTAGVLVNAVLKSGGNDVHVDFYLDYENKDLQGTNVTDALRRLGVGEGTRITKYIDPNVNVGGPIKRDKIWFFSGLRNQRIGTTVAGWPVEDPGNFDFPTKLDALTAKVTYQISANNKLGVYAQGRRKLQPYRDAGSTLYRDAVYSQDSGVSYGGLDYNRVVSPTFFFTTRLSTWGYNWPNKPYGVNMQHKEDIRNRMQELTTGNIAGGGYATRRDRRRYQFDWNGVLFKDNWGGANHVIKVGYLTEWENTEYTRDGYKDSVLLIFRSAVGALDFTTPFRATIYNEPTTAVDALWHHGAFVQDQIVTDHVTVNAGIRWDYYSVYYPAEDIRPHRYRDFFYAGAPLPNGYTIPASYPSFEVPERRGILQYSKALGPRLGVAWDLTGDRKTVLKANWGLFWNNPGPALASSVNPIQALSYTFAWNDRNADRLFTPDELGSFVSSTGGVRNVIDPDIRQPHVHDVSVWAEREIVANVSGRVGLIYKRLQNNFQNIELNRVGSLYTAKVETSDPGPDGILGTADDRGAFTVFDIPAGIQVPASRTKMESPNQNDSNYTSIELTLNKRMTERWALVTSFHHTWSNELLYGVPQNPNQEINNEQKTTVWGFKAFATYRAPRGVTISPVVRHQAGDPLGRVVQVTGLRTGTFNYMVEPVGAYRGQNVTILDARIEKMLNLTRKYRLTLFFDAFNIANSNAADSQDSITGRRTAVVDRRTVEYQRFLRPTVIIGPRIYRLGFRWSF